jgi:uncharacterized membrane protein
MNQRLLAMDTLAAGRFTGVMLDLLRALSLLAATLMTGAMTGVFGIYANAIMPGLRATDDRTFVGAFQSIDRAIINPLFMLTFLGALVFAAVAAGLHAGERSVLVWVAAAFVLYLAVVVVTLAINVPLNDALKAAGDPDRIADLAQVRDRFDEARWVGWNIVRTILSAAAFACLAWALVEYGRTSE